MKNISRRNMIEISGISTIGSLMLPSLSKKTGTSGKYKVIVIGAHPGDPECGCEDHRICSVLAYDAWINMGKKFALYYYEVTSGNETQHFYPTNYIDISKVIKQKDDACMAHISQDPQGWYVDIQSAIQRFRGIEYNCKFAEAFVRHNQNPSEALVIQKTGFSDQALNLR